MTTTWDSEDNAAAYDAYAVNHPFYVDSSRDLVRLAAIEPGHTVLDLACGTGATTRALHDLHGGGLTITGVDRSDAQLTHARRRHPDVRFLRRSSDQVGDLGPFDRIICNAAFWQLPTAATLAALEQATRPGARLAFNMPAFWLVGERPPASEDEDLPFHMARIARDHYGYDGGGFTGRGHPGVGFFRAFAESRWRLIHQEDNRYTLAPEEALAWYRVPIFRRNVLFSMDAETSAKVLDDAWEAWRPNATSSDVDFPALVAERL